MPTETQLPDALLENSGFASIVLGDIDEDPDAPDAGWAAASSNNNATIARVGFPTPTGNPSGVQTFKMYVRKNAASGTGTPTARIDLYENGTLLASGSEQNVTSTTGQMLSQNFDLAATPLTTATGVDVEARFVGTQSGGSPSARSSVDLGAIDWDTVNYTTELVYQKTGAAISAALVTAVDAYEATEAGQATSAAAAVAADVSEFIETGLVVMGEIGGGITYQKTGAVVSAASASATDVFEATELGMAVSASVIAGTSSQIATYEKTGTVASAAVAAGADMFEAVEAGTAVSAAVVAGISEHQLPGGVTYSKTGAVVSAASFAGADAYEAVETGAALAAGSASAGDATTYTETGGPVAHGIASAADANIYTDIGAVVSALVASGVKLLPGMVVAGDVVIITPTPTQISPIVTSEPALASVSDTDTGFAVVSDSDAADVAITT